MKTKRQYWGYRIDNNNSHFFYEELKKGRLRQGWGYNLGQNLKCFTYDEGARKNIKILHAVKEGDILLVPHIPLWDDISIVEATKDWETGYHFDIPEEQGDFGHIFPAKLIKTINKDSSSFNDSIRSSFHCAQRFWSMNKHALIIDMILNDANRPSVDIFPIQKLLAQELSIPDYQRPYVWSTENVDQLLNDVKKSMEMRKCCFRLGSIILHENNIIDGQQRITTLALLYYALKKNNEIKCNLSYNHNLSIENIKKNYDYIKSWLSRIYNIKEFEDFLLNKCECVVLKFFGEEGVSMAFKVFDSQNGRGKELEPYNLLKAYHLRAMDKYTSKEKIFCDRNWEQATRYKKTPQDTTIYDILKHLFDEQLYRSRLWSRNMNAWSFNKKHIGEFKGMYVDKKHKPNYPFQNNLLLLYMNENFYQGFLMDIMSIRTRFTNNDDIGISPFTQINQPIVNGKNFFEYIQTYTELYKRLFIELETFQLHDFKDFYKEHCLEYYGHWRTGDNYVREMYKSIVLCLFDKFGEETLNKYYMILYLLTYSVRRKNTSVFYSTVAKHPQKYFAIIINAKSEYDLEDLQNYIEWEIKDGRKDFDEYEKVIKKIKKLNYEQ